jgi:hypothetical protein
MEALGEHDTAGVFLGAVTDGVLAHSNPVAINEIPDYNDLVITLRSRLGEGYFTAATARGAALTYEQAAAFALEATEKLGRD